MEHDINSGGIRSVDVNTEHGPACSELGVFVVHGLSIERREELIEYLEKGLVDLVKAWVA